LTAAAAVFKGTVKTEDKDPVAQMEWYRKPIISAINELHITAGFEIAQTNINKKKQKRKKIIKEWKQMKQGKGNTIQ
jgi:hypothetical protein